MKLFDVNYNDTPKQSVQLEKSEDAVNKNLYIAMSFNSVRLDVFTVALYLISLIYHSLEF